MLVKIFDFEHELDLEEAINDFMKKSEIKVVKIHYQTSHFFALNDQIFSFSALIEYEILDDIS